MYLWLLLIYGLCFASAILVLAKKLDAHRKSNPRQIANRHLVELLHQIVEMNPDLRFSQILSAFEFVDRIELDKYIQGWQGHVWADEFNTEPSVILERVQKAIRERIKS